MGELQGADAVEDRWGGRGRERVFSRVRVKWEESQRNGVVSRGGNERGRMQVARK